MRSKIVLFAALAALACSGSALAQSTGFYGGVGLGKSKASLNRGDFGATSYDEKDSAWKLFAGYKFTPNLAAELGYTDLGKFKALDPLGNVDYKASSWTLAGVGMFPVTGGFSVLGKLGLAYNRAEASDPSGSAKKRKTDLLWGIGGQYDFNQRVGLRLEYEDYGKFGDDSNTGRAKVNLWSLNLVYRF